MLFLLYDMVVVLRDEKIAYGMVVEYNKGYEDR